MVRSEHEFPFRDGEFRNMEGSARLQLQDTRSRVKYLASLKTEMQQPANNTNLASAQATSNQSPQAAAAVDNDLGISKTECPCCAEEFSKQRRVRLYCRHE